MTDLLAALDLVKRFKGPGLALTIAELEHAAESRTPEQLRGLLQSKAITPELLQSAVAVKRASAQIDEVVHAAGTLLCMEEILQPGEIIECLSLGAGNTGRSFDLETNFRIAEFTFIEWKGGSESIRKKKIFKDFYVLAEALTEKQRFLYLVGDTHGPKAFLSRSPCVKMLNKFADLREQFVARYGRTMTVREYFDLKREIVKVMDLNSAAKKISVALAR